MTLQIRAAFLTLIFYTFSATFCDGQKMNFHCIEKYKKSDNTEDSIIIQTCFLNAYKFVTTSYPDYKGRYTYSEHKVFVLKNHKYLDITNSEVFNGKQNSLVKIINEKIQKDFKDFSADGNTKDCFTGIDSIPTYKMDDLGISFYGNEIWFEVNWDLSSACTSVNGTIVSFKINEIKKYLK